MTKNKKTDIQTPESLLLYNKPIIPLIEFLEDYKKKRAQIIIYPQSATVPDDAFAGLLYASSDLDLQGTRIFLTIERLA